MSEENIFAITMPKWGMAMETGTVLDWLVSQGDEVEKGDEVLEVESDKIAGVVESNDSGVLALMVASPADELPVGALLGVLTRGEVDSDVVEAFVSRFHKDFVPEEAGKNKEDGELLVHIEDVRIAYQRIDASENEDEIPVVFVHGFGGDQNSWLFNTTELSSCRRLYVLDLPGHGNSSKKVGDGSLEELANIVRKFLTAIDVQRAHFVGHSLGAAVLLELGRIVPAKVASLTLLGSAGRGTEVNKQYIEGFVSARRRKEIKPFLQQLFARPELVSRDMIEGVLRAKRIEGAEDCLLSIAQASLFCPTQMTLGESLNSVDIPMQLIWGKDDQIADVSQAQGLVGAFEVHIIENVGHMVHMEAASMVNKYVASFISGLAAQENTN